MTNTVLIKRSGTANAIPTAGQLSLGELAINYNDGNLFYKNSGGTVTLLTSNQFVSVAGNVTGGNILTSGLVSATGNIVGGNLNAVGLSLSGNVVSAMSLSSSLTAATTISAVGNVTGGNLRTGGQVSATGAVYALEFFATQSAPSEGGQITLSLPSSGSTLTGNVIIDVYNNQLRFFEGGGTNRGAYIDLTAASAGVGTNLLASGGGGTPGGSNTYVQFNDGGAFGGNSQFTYDKVTNTLTVGIVASTNNGAGTNFKVGDDAWIGDINIADTIRITGQQNGANAYIVFGNADGTQLGRAGTGPLTYGGAFSASGNVTGGNVITAGAVSAASVSASANITGGNVNTGGVLSVTGRTFVASGNAAAPGITFSSDIAQDTGFYLISDGNVGVTTNGTLRASFFDTGFSAVGNITGANLNAAGLSLSSNVVSALNVTSNIAGGNITTPGLISATGNVTGGNITTGGLVTATGNVAAANFTTGGNVVATSGNVSGGNVAAVTTIFSFGTIQGTGNVSGGNLTTTGQVSSTANVTGGNIITAGTVSAASVSASGNITGGNVNTNTLVGTGTTVKSTGDLNLSATGNVTLNSTYINNLANPVQDQDAATKYYVDTVAQGLHVHDSANLASTADLATYTGATVTYNNGTSGVGATLSLVGNTLTTLDGTAIPASARLLIKNQANAVTNGMYVYTSSSLLTRATDFDTTAEAAGGDFLFVTSGATLADTGWVQTTDNPTIGTDPLVFTQFSGAGTYTANTAAGLVLVGSVFNAKTDGVTTDFDGSGNIIVKASAALTTPNIGAATGTSLSVTGNITGGNLNAAGLSLSSNVVSALNSTANITTTANVSAGFFLGDGSQLTGIATGSSTKISNGTSEANIGTTNGNANITIGGVSNVAVFTTGGLNITGVVSATGNITGGNLNAAGLSLSSNVVSALNVTPNIAGGNITTPGVISAGGNITGANVISNQIFYNLSTYAANVTFTAPASSSGLAAGPLVFNNGVTGTFSNSTRVVIV